MHQPNEMDLDQQVIHQDIKPTNFLIRMRKDQPNHPDLLLADFGIAKLTSATASASQSIRGTPTYMAPEQWDGHPVTATDQYALAIMVYELLVGRPPFQGGPGQVMRQHYLTPPPAPSMLNPRLSLAIDAVLLRALAKQPDERFPSVAAFAHAFQQAAQSSGELHATLAISRAEATMGTTRRLTLPGGRHVSVTVPAGVPDGALLRLEGQGMPYYEGGPTGPLFLTITIPPAEASLPPRQVNVEPTLFVPPNLSGQTPPAGETKIPARSDAQGMREPTISAPPSRDQIFDPTAYAASVPSPPMELVTPVRHTPLPPELARSSAPQTLRPDVMIPVKPLKRSASRRLVLIGLVGLVIVALASGIVWLTTHHATPAGVVTEFPIPTSRSIPIGIAAGSDGSLWFIERDGDKIGRITTSGNITEFPLTTPKSFPIQIAAGPDGSLWFTEYDGNKIGRITTSGSITEFVIPSSQSSPNGIAAGSDGALWFAEGAGNKIGRITTSGSITEFVIPSPQSNPDGITAGPDGNLWFTEFGSKKIGRITTNGSITEFAIPTSQSSELFWISGGSDGAVWFTEGANNKIGRISTNGSFTEFALPTLKSFPVQIVAGPDGNLWFTERDGNKIGRISTSGSITEFSIPTPKSTSIGITAGPDGNLWFTEADGNKIGRITSGN